jgi:hypothetical protein
MFQFLFVSEQYRSQIVYGERVNEVRQEKYQPVDISGDSMKRHFEGDCRSLQTKVRMRANLTQCQLRRHYAPNQKWEPGLSEIGENKLHLPIRETIRHALLLMEFGWRAYAADK